MNIRYEIKPTDETLREWNWSISRGANEYVFKSGIAKTKESAERYAKTAAQEYMDEKKKDLEAKRIIRDNTFTKIIAYD